MRHLQIGRKLGVNSDHRKALLRSLTLALIENDSIKTTTARAKELRWYAERIVTLAKRGDVASRRHIVKLLGSTRTIVPGKNRVRMAIDRVYSDLAPRFQTRPGGYTQILKLATRRAGDNADMCMIRYIPVDEPKKETDRGSKKAAAPKAKKTKTKAAASAEPKAKTPAKTSKKKAKTKEE